MTGQVACCGKSGNTGSFVLVIRLYIGAQIVLIYRKIGGQMNSDEIMAFLRDFKARHGISTALSRRCLVARGEFPQ